MPDGRYRGLRQSVMDKIKDWVREGGTLIAFKGALNKLNSSIIEFENIPSPGRNYNTYADRQEKSAEHVIGGAIFQSTIDTSYPLFYGYSDKTYYSFKRGTLAIKKSNNVLANPMIYKNQPLFSGYSSKENLDRISETSGLVVYGVGRGRVVGSLDNPLFRGYWRGGNKLFDNMLFISSAISSVGLRED